MFEFDHPMHWAEAALLATGVILLINLLISITRGHRWDEVLTFPAPKPNDITPIDVWLALALYLLIPGLVAQTLGHFFPNAIPSSQPAAVEHTPTEQIAASAASMSLIAAGLLLIGRRPFKSLSAWGLTNRIPDLLVPALLDYVMIWPICSLLSGISTFTLHLLFPALKFEEHNTIVMLTGNDGVIPKVLLIINAMILAPVSEELFFRGIVFTFIRSIAGVWPAIIVSGLLFGLFHYPLWQFMLPLAFFGMVLAYLYARSNSLTLVVMIHIIFNAKTLAWLALGARD